MASVFRYSNLKKILGNLTKQMRDCFSFSPRHFWGSVGNEGWLGCQTKHTLIYCRFSCIWLSFWQQIPRKKRKIFIKKKKQLFFCWMLTKEEFYLFEQVERSPAPWTCKLTFAISWHKRSNDMPSTVRKQKPFLGFSWSKLEIKLVKT